MLIGAGVLYFAALLVARLASDVREPGSERARFEPQAEEEGPSEGQVQATVCSCARVLARPIAPAHTGIGQSSQ